MTAETLAQWWLVLGSNAGGEDRFEAARRELAGLGEVVAVSREALGEDIGGGERPYRNQLLSLRCGLDEAALVAALKAIERRCGRSPARMAQGICDLDLDLLARLDRDSDPQWRSDKPLRIPAVRALVEAWQEAVK